MSKCHLSIRERLQSYAHCFGDGCWEWTRSRNAKGYGTLGVNGKSQLAHRVSFEEYVGPIPPGLYVLHRCDNPPCINPSHLFTGTQLDNMRDAVAKNRYMTEKRRNNIPRGEMFSHSKLNDESVVEMREAYASGRISQSELGRRYDLSQATVRAVVHRNTWKHIPETEAEKMRDLRGKESFLPGHNPVWNIATMSCEKGHPWSENEMQWKDKRACRSCQKARQLRRLILARALRLEATVAK